MNNHYEEEDEVVITDDNDDVYIDYDGTIISRTRRKSRCEWLNDPSLTPAQRNYFNGKSI